MLFIRKLLWDKRSIFHIARHNIIPEEVDEVCQKDPIILRGTKLNRVVLLGLTSDKRLLNVVLENKGSGNYYPITAYDASSTDKVLFKNIKGGEEN